MIASRMTGILGEPGAGKTNKLTDIALRAYILGIPIIADYHLKLPAYENSPPIKYATFKEIAQLSDNTIRGAKVLIDELSEGADAYEFWDIEVQDISRLASQRRKQRFDIYYTDQRFNKVARRLRQLTDRFIIMEDLDENIDHTWDKELNPTGYKCKGIFRQIFCDKYGNPIRVRNFNGVPSREFYDETEVISKNSQSESSGKISRARIGRKKEVSEETKVKREFREKMRKMGFPI